MKEERSRGRGKRKGWKVTGSVELWSGSLCGPATTEGVDASAEEQRWWKELRRPCFLDITYCPSSSADCPAISTGIIISAGKFSPGDERSFPCRHCRRIAIKLLMGEKPPDLSTFHFFFLSLLFRVAWELWKLFRSYRATRFPQQKVRTHVSD